MRWLGVLAGIGACSGTPAPPPVDAGAVSLELDIPHGMLDPKGYAMVEIVLHEPSGDVTRTATVDASGHFDLDRIDPSTSVSIEATLRNDLGAAMGYGRTAVAAALAGGAKIVVPMRRPMAYFAGTVSRAPNNNASNPLHWTEVPATFADLSGGASFDGRTVVGSNAVLMVAAGPSLYLVTQATSDPNGALTGAATILPISTADHAVGAALPGTMTGAVIDGAGSDDGKALVIGTTAQLYAIDTASGAARALTDGNFARVAIVEQVQDGLEVALRVFGATGSAVQRYRSWCDGAVNTNAFFTDWECAALAGQSTAATDTLEHHIGSMTFQFGKK